MINLSTSNNRGLLGYRGWNLVWEPASFLLPSLKQGPSLMSLTWVEYWDNQPKTAFCYRSTAPCTQSPKIGCECGYWMTETPEELNLHTCNYCVKPNLFMTVAGLVQAWGRCIRHERGIRCEHMRIVALLGKTTSVWRGVAHDEDEEISGIGKQFDIPVLSTLEELVRFKSDWEAR